MAERFRFGDFEFDAGSYELRRIGGGIQRLAPQPGQLLHLLASRSGDVVTREEIRQRLWPQTHVDFDASLHFCVRQVRTALADSANEPRYVQNVPRRGYRLIPAVSPAGEAAAAAPAPVAALPARRPTPVPPAVRMLAALVLLAGGALAAWQYASMTRDGSLPPPVRIAIMPFEPPIAERILEHLSAAGGRGVALVGPTTTSAYAGGEDGIRRVAAAYRVDYVLNGRPLVREGPPRVLAELIRVSDGAHVWVRPYEDLGDRDQVGRDIARQVARALKLGG